MSTIAHALREELPEDATRAVLIFHDADGKTKVKWIGLLATDVASLLYEMADEVLRQRVPLEQPPR